MDQLQVQSQRSELVNNKYAHMNTKISSAQQTKVSQPTQTTSTSETPIYKDLQSLRFIGGNDPLSFGLLVIVLILLLRK